MHSVEWNDVINIVVGWALTFVLGFEREVRGAPAGDRTFSMIGLSAALIGAIAPHYPAVLGGAVTGIGFIGGGLCFRQAVKEADHEREILHGVTTAASIFGAAAIGAIAGCGDLVLAVAATIGIMLSLEIRHIPVLRYMDARRWAHLFADDNHRHFKLHDIEHALAHPHQEYGAIKSAVQHTHAHPQAVIPAQAEAPADTAVAVAAAAAETPKSASPGEASEASGAAAGTEAAEAVNTTVHGNAHEGMSLVGPIEDESLVKEAETASILANQVISASIARSGR
ncbi:MgtC/SapB family protein [Actinospica sp. MGRD01-02]|uniref:MgtC/SapB family protein n=1 Tax=Actinospica acidithermotolerans TaxID=2828514 RepID=A0A941EGV9_9ACTN|nr:MgtC/SapB family protein [Actinospica acidithermotolerans]MBR7831257.1 MgtC/SapB family protein [Actinospica acidithermotolerans]